MTFHYSTIDLPIKEIIPDIQQKLLNETSLIVHAPPGAGKSTIVPLALLNEPWLQNKKILILEPRRLAARSIAMRMASLLGEEVGNIVGYRIRFENKVSKNTRIEVLTEGILARMLHSDPELSEVGLVIFDEFHERSIHADLALALSRESQQVLRNDLRLVIMSATLNTVELTKLLQANCVSSKGKQYPVDIIYTQETDLSIISEQTSRLVLRAVKEQKGDILVFLPGEAEIKKCEELLLKSNTECRIHPLYGMLPPNQQYAAIMPDKQGRRKIVLATSIAETSLTIEGVSVVVDSGLGRTMRFNPNSGLSKLETISITLDSADQRAGRAGRLGPGVCYRMWSKANNEKRPSHRTPEILEADLTSLVLDITKWGISDIQSMSWLNPLPVGHVKQAYETLDLIDAIKSGKITEHGNEISELPCHPRIAHMLICAKDEGCAGLATDIAALLEERDPLSNEAGIDINTRIEALRKQRKEDKLQRQMQRIEKVAESYRRMLKIEIDNSIFDPYETGLLLMYAYPERIACAIPGNNAMFQLANGRIASAGHKDDLAHESWLVVANMHIKDNGGKIFLASPVNPKDLKPFVKDQERIYWDINKGGLQAAKELRIGSIVLQSKPLQNPDKQMIEQVICDTVEKDGKRLLNFSDEVEQLQNRVVCIKTWNNDERWPDFSTENLLKTTRQWLLPYIQNIRKNEDLKSLQLHEILKFSLDYSLQKELEELMPENIEVPSGSSIKIEYQSNCSAPVLSVRLQEVFGMQDTPTVNNGKNKLLMHLLSPGYKPVQVTSDLKSFWNSTYFEVKKELRVRYSKHYWPDDPFEAIATNKTVKAMKRDGLL